VCGWTSVEGLAAPRGWFGVVFLFFLGRLYDKFDLFRGMAVIGFWEFRRALECVLLSVDEDSAFRFVCEWFKSGDIRS